MTDSELIQVTAEPIYIESQSDAQAGRFVFAYTIHIQNNSNRPVQLLRRYWSITDGNGKTVEVRGDGVIGEQPHLAPGEHYTYTSGSVIETPVGTMHGHYEMQNTDGTEFTTLIPLFRLAVPGCSTSMARYVVGDVQGCFDELQQLVQLIKFDPANDQLWFCGDLIARGPKSLETLQYVKSLGSSAITVLGNHDLNFLASNYGFGRIESADQLSALQQSAALPELVDWLLHQPLIHYDAKDDILLVHAGLAPEWDIETALTAARAVELALAANPKLLFSQMYGNQPRLWQDAENDAAKIRFTINACTRMRYCDRDGSLNLKEKGGISENPSLVPWYDFWANKPHPKIFFGHWAALLGHSPVANIHALDTGCVWGETLTCYCIESSQRYSVEGYKKRL